MSATTDDYDALPYENLLHPWTFPARIAAEATLFGLSPPPSDRCRVLELGCAAGANLVPMAEIFPGSTFLGVDGSARQIEAGVAAVRAAGLPNIELRTADILAIDESWGRFDYIICHGVYSWVPAPVRAKILDICRHNLAPNGVAHISYNTYPGWRLRGIVRDLMLQTQTAAASPQAKVDKARAMLALVAAQAKVEPYATFIRNEKRLLDANSDAYLFHDHLERDNEPLYFRDFMRGVTAQRLAYLGEADVKQMCAHNFGPIVTPVATSGGAMPALDQIEAEQLADFVVFRQFRETLLVHADNAPRWAIEPDAIGGLHVASTGRLQDPARSELADTVAYVSPSGNVLETASPILQAAMALLARRWPATIPFGELLDAVRDMATSRGAAGSAEAMRRELATGLIRTCVLSDLTELYGAAIRVPDTIGTHPKALRCARLAACAGASQVGNVRHQRVDVGPDFDRRLLALLDGTRDRAQLIGMMSADAEVDRALAAFRSNGLLVG